MESYMREKNLVRRRYCKDVVKRLSYFSMLRKEWEEQGERSGGAEDDDKRKNGRRTVVFNALGTSSRFRCCTRRSESTYFYGGPFFTKFRNSMSPFTARFAPLFFSQRYGPDNLGTFCT